MDPEIKVCTHLRKVEMPVCTYPDSDDLKYGVINSHYYLELHLIGFGIIGPAALLYVEVDAVSHDAEILNLFVHDCIRRRGYGTLLMKEARRIFPDATWTASDDSIAFHQALVAAKIAKNTSKKNYTWE